MKVFSVTNAFRSVLHYVVIEVFHKLISASVENNFHIFAFTKRMVCLLSLSLVYGISNMSKFLVLYVTISQYSICNESN